MINELPPVEYRLCEAHELFRLSEQVVLPAIELASCERYINFPIRSDLCIPVNSPRFMLQIPRISLFRTDDVLLNGFRLLEQDGKLFNDTSLVSYFPARINVEFKAKLSAPGDYECISRSFLQGERKDTTEVASPGGVLVLASEEPYNFGSWIFRFLPKYLLARRLGWSGSVMVYQQPWMTKLLKFSGQNHNLIEHNPQRQYRIRDAIIPSLSVPEVLFRQEILSLFESLHARQARNISLGEKIYVSRRQQAVAQPLQRTLENETGLVAALTELGFVEFIPENYPIGEQIAIFDRARIIVGCGGSNMFGCVFARQAELIVDIESCDEWLHAHRNLFSSNRASFSIILGQRTGRGQIPHQNWQIDIEALVQGLRILIGR
jgi:hypothetical protein